MPEPKLDVWVTLPTYNEAGNIEALARALLGMEPGIGIVVIDDDSPDGTWRIAGELRAEFPGRIEVLRRIGERGRGTAGVAGFRKALELGAQYVVEMDADWSHDPRFLPAMLAAARGGADVAIGSRLVRGGGERDRSAVRSLLTRAANAYIRAVLWLPVRDCTSGYRVFRRWVLEGIDWDRVDSRGPAIVQEVLLACKAQGAKLVEIPILFEPRRAGRSTFNTRIMLAGLWAVLKFRFRRPSCLPERPRGGPPQNASVR